ncbi:GDSL esterase/lipase At1g71691-like [Hibiscus syriacus]|uniref:GDSL esterase/lipase At1g71691-like n=1 Tax=Hibiscus syriacus TaxID=106335 RepID=UPI001920E34E|nr:GDSL esterase/lipase At1g71691-like [Hibiscus syriacus]
MLGMSAAEKENTLTVVNYGSGSSGIQALPPTVAPIFGHVLRFEEQINLFKETTGNMRSRFASLESLALYMSKSLFFIHIGSNDLGVYWEFGQRNAFFSNATEYALGLSKNLSRGLEEIYELGARKFLVNNVPPMGCWPANLNIHKPKTSCVEDINQRLSYYNGVLPNMLKNLEASLKGSTFVVCDLYRLFGYVFSQPAAYGFWNVSGFCCPDSAGNGTRECAKGGVPCMDRETIVFFDPVHPTERFHFQWVRSFLLDDSLCSPYNLLELIQL